MYYKGYKVRIYPTKEQEELLWKHINACRFIWNYMLNLQDKRYKNGDKHLSSYGMMKLIPLLKNDGRHEWLYEVSGASLQIVCGDLDDAYKNFFEKMAKFPKFKTRKKSNPIFPSRVDRFYFKDDKVLSIDKVGKIKYKTDFDIPVGRNVCKFANVRVSYDKTTYKWFVSFAMGCENQAPELNDVSVGIDLGVKELAVVAFGENEKIVFHNINKSSKMKNLEKKLKHTQRIISRKYEKNKKGKKYVKTKNIIREEEKLRKLFRKIANIRDNYIHYVTHEIVSMLPKRVVMEDLNVSEMLKHKYINNLIFGQCFYTFTERMRYKCESLGIEFVQVDRFYPSSKMCSSCGNIKHNLKLRDRTYVCDHCGTVIDRDYNAALNLSRYVA